MFGYGPSMVEYYVGNMLISGVKMTPKQMVKKAIEIVDEINRCKDERKNCRKKADSIYECLVKKNKEIIRLQNEIKDEIKRIDKLKIEPAYNYNAKEYDKLGNMRKSIEKIKNDLLKQADKKAGYNRYSED